MADPNPVEVLARMIPSLGLIVGALLLVRRWAAKGRPGGGGAVRVVSRTGLTRGSVLAVVEVTGRRYLLGAGDSGVTLLTALEAPSPFDSSGVPADVDLVRLNAAGDPAPVRPASLDRPWMGLVSRLQRRTVRTSPSRPSDALSPSIRP